MYTYKQTHARTALSPTRGSKHPLRLVSPIWLLHLHPVLSSKTFSALPLPPPPHLCGQLCSFSHTSAILRNRWREIKYSYAQFDAWKIQQKTNKQIKPLVTNTDPYLRSFWIPLTHKAVFNARPRCLNHRWIFLKFGTLPHVWHKDAIFDRNNPCLNHGPIFNIEPHFWNKDPFLTHWSIDTHLTHEAIVRPTHLCMTHGSMFDSWIHVWHTSLCITHSEPLNHASFLRSVLTNKCGIFLNISTSEMQVNFFWSVFGADSDSANLKKNLAHQFLTIIIMPYRVRLSNRWFFFFQTS